METTLHNETTFYQDANVTVTQSRYVTEAKTYAMRDISAVHFFEIIKSRKLPIGLCIIGCLLLAPGEIRMFGLLLVGIGAVIWSAIKNECVGRISTKGGGSDSLVSKNKTYLETVAHALNEAIIRRV